ncbi:ABC transporter, ATP-binding protein domain containing protein [Theileria equi strain WA]|uniref:ABC transporter, ATP-binding protein domain containing protein n=1 Tax=Theileria equi strain WA TaxID=1537102 RepID=L1LF91_THEEQ|nr:ABC transporter, ATP-binding protein domain containing protein [Theileria equi strain WA]EKX74107.1 ABC transporter, ATP-binding protein domain containing protein [Theileria equi strain WA]|eukprot:XP_004833559.1 ABC transporter, ATP-binding protein domain containing protein [Theileria equi strain WA]
MVYYSLVVLWTIYSLVQPAYSLIKSQKTQEPILYIVPHGHNIQKRDAKVYNTSASSEEILKDVKEWIGVKNKDELNTSPLLDANVSSIFPSNKVQKGSSLLSVRNASIWLGERVLFDNISLSLHAGDCVGIVGNNGTGKSTLFNSIYSRLSGKDFKNLAISMDVVFNSEDNEDVNTSRYSYLYTILSRLMENQSIDDETVSNVLNGNYTAEEDKSTIFTYNVSGVGYMKQDYTLDLNPESRVIDAISEVFDTYNVCNNVVNFVEKNLQTFNNLAHSTIEEVARVTKEILMLYNLESKVIRTRFNDIKILIRRLINIFGMEEVVESQIKTLSGGFRMRLYLLLLLMHSPSLLLLDEPTNNLDNITVEFLIEILKYLMNSCGLSIFLVSHDTRLLNAICTSILLVSGDGKIHSHSGNFDDFIESGSSATDIKASKILKLQKSISRLTSEIKIATDSTKGSQKAKKVAISQKTELLKKHKADLEALMGTNVSKYTSSYDKFLFKKDEENAKKKEKSGRSIDKMDQVFEKKLIYNDLLKNGELTKDVDKVAILEGLTLKTAEGKKIFSNLNLDIFPTERIVLLGNNGIGKSTLLKLLYKSQDVRCFDNETGYKSEFVEGKGIQKMKNITSLENMKTEVGDKLATDEEFTFKMDGGSMLISPLVSIKYYSQNCSSILNYTHTVQTLLSEHVSVEDLKELYQYLSCFYLEEFMDTPVSELSFGERSRLLLALLFLTDSNFLLLDEPTNHLDVFMQHRLKILLQKVYRGGFILATHDLKFINELGCIDSYIYIHSPNAVFTFNNQFAKAYAEFREQNPQSDNYQLYQFLKSTSENPNYTRVYTPRESQICTREEEKRQEKRRKTFGGANAVPMRRIKNIKRWN